MKLIPHLAGALLGLLFLVFSLNFFFHFLPNPPGPPEGSPAALFMGALFPTGYLAFVKVIELAGAVLVAIPRTRNLGLLMLGPIVVNILAFHIFITKGAGLLTPPVLAVAALSLFLLVCERKAFAGLVSRAAN